MKRTKMALMGLAWLGLMIPAAVADPVGLTRDKASITVETGDGPVIIQRPQDNDATIQGDFAKIARACPPFCIQPMQVETGVATWGELEVLAFLEKGEGLLIDARTEEWHFKETIPGSVNIPYIDIGQRLDDLGCKQSGGEWDCAQAQSLVLYCNGPWCGQSPRAIRVLLRAGYPADRLHYYRGGMQAWKMLGLTTVEGGL